MILTVLYLGFEALAIVLVLHSLYGKAFKLNKYIILYILLDISYLCLVQYGGFPEEYSVAGYILMFLYTGIEFGFSADRILVNDTLCLLVIAALQLLFGSVMSLFMHIGLSVNLLYFAANAFPLFVAAFFAKSKMLNKVSRFFLSKNMLVICVCIMDFLILLLWLLNVRNSGEIILEKGVLILILVSLFALLVYNLGKSTLRAKQLKTENEIQKLYNTSFEGLVTKIRMRQHEFDNHLNAIYGMMYTYKTYDELVAAQQEYACEVRKENKFNKLLSSGNYTLIGFLYNKFLDIDASEIEIEYHVAVKEMQSKVPLYVLIEIIGNLLDNAKEALLKQDEKKMLIRIMEEEDQIRIEIANKNSYVGHDTIDSFFEKGKSSKGAERGFGLYHVKQLCKEHNIQIACTNKEIESNNYLSFCLAVMK